MGWTQIPGYTREQTVEEILQEEEGFKLLKSFDNGVDQVWSMWHYTKGTNDKKVIEVAILDGDNMYKRMDESMGPCYYDCPVEWLPEVKCPGQWATDWRLKVKAVSSNKARLIARLVQSSLFGGA
jgi:hypothetical protein